MSNSKHTKGEWINTTDGEANFYGVCTKQNWLLRIQQNGELTVFEQEANAKLIAAAPDLLNAALEVNKEFDDPNECLTAFKKLQEAIDKATK